METDEFVEITPGAIAELLRVRHRRHATTYAVEQRSRHRWPFQGAVQIWLCDSHGTEEYLISTCHNLNEDGVGVTCERPLRTGLTLPIAIHQPEASYYGHATVRHCTANPKGYMIGMEFNYRPCGE